MNSGYCGLIRIGQQGAHIAEQNHPAWKRSTTARQEEAVSGREVPLVIGSPRQGQHKMGRGQAQGLLCGAPDG